MSNLNDLHALIVASYDVDAAIPHKRIAANAAALRTDSPCVTPEHTNDALLEFFTERPEQGNVAVVDGGRPIGLVNKHIFMEAYAKPFAREIFGRRSCIAWMHKDPLVVDELTPLETLLKLAVETGESVLKDGFITVRDGTYSGIGSGFALMQAMSDLEAEKTRQLLDSIDYASSIQRAQLKTSDEHLAPAFGDASLVWQPRDVVGGDCYFVRRFAHGGFAAIVDCTGHGVPGAFMTLIALSWLEQRSQQLAAGAEVRVDALLGELNRYVKQVLGQRGAGAATSLLDAGAAKNDDGMDIAMLWLPADGDHLEFASSHLALMLVDPGGEMPEIIEGDKAGVGYASTPDDTEWPLHRLPLGRARRALIVTDGVIDQLGGPKGLALGKKRLAAYFAEQSGHPAVEMGERLTRFVRDWQGSQARRDDVTAFCFTTPERLG